MTPRLNLLSQERGEYVSDSELEPREYPLVSFIAGRASVPTRAPEMSQVACQVAGSFFHMLFGREETFFAIKAQFLAADNHPQFSGFLEGLFYPIGG